MSPSDPARPAGAPTRRERPVEVPDQVTIGEPTGEPTDGSWGRNLGRAGGRTYPAALFRSELHLVFGRTRTWMMLAALAAVPVVIGVAIRVVGGAGAEGFIGRVTENGVFLVVAALALSMPVFLPTAVTVAAGESLAGEASLGTLRTVVIAPAGRSRLLAAKMVAIAAFCLAATMTVWAAGLITGLLLFPVGDVPTLSGTTVPLAEGLLRALGIAGLISGSMLGLAAIGLFVSSLTSTPLAAMAATFAAYVVIGILDVIPQISAIHPWLLMDAWFSFADLLRDPPYWDLIGRNLAVQGAYVAVFYAAAWARLTSRDISG